MISADELREYITTMQAAGITGRAKIGDIEVTIPPAAVTGGEARTDKPARTSKQTYDAFLFAATEGLPEDLDEAKS